MKASHLLRQFARHFAAAALLGAAAFAQSAPEGGASQRFARDGLAFEYPTGWTLEDLSDANAQHLLLARAGGAALVRVVVYREPLQDFEQFIAAGRNIWTPYVKDLAGKLGVAELPSREESKCQAVGDSVAAGVRLSGQLEGRPSVGEVYALVLGRRYVNLFFVRAERDDAAASAAWQTVLDTLKVDVPLGAPPSDEDFKNLVDAGIINASAVKKAAPEYPLDAKRARATGTINVRVLVDEQGDVVTAKAFSGHRLLWGPSERAVRKWKFTPTKLCGRPMRTAGIAFVTYTLR
ncbi:MAG TPA: energy transducer TonB [Pyrinomonadaceae bacterium]|nr:energy transducer TonB [Pyrinomonadaceae bacterium]